LDVPAEKNSSLTPFVLVDMCPNPEDKGLKVNDLFQL
jgi:hypothetical protein